MENIYYQRALRFIEENDLHSLPNGTHVIEEGKLWVNITDSVMRTQENAPLEAHNEYIDIQIPLSGPESYGVKDRSECVKPRGEFDAVGDFILYDDEYDKVVTVPRDGVIVFKPSDCHAPLIGEGTIHKAIFKVKVV